MSRWIFASLVVLSFVSCGEKKPENFTQDKTLYEYAEKLFKNGEYTQSITFFESLKNRFPQSPYAAEAELKIGDSHFEKGDYMEAEMSYRNFRTLHPTHEKVPYALFRNAMTHYKRKPGSIDRDQTEAQQTLDTFSELTTNWPDSKEAAEARPLVEKCRRSLAEREMYVANYYMKHRLFPAAVGRLKTVSENSEFPDLKVEALYKLGYAYFRMHDKENAKVVLTELAGQSGAGKYAAQAKNLLRDVR